MTTFRRCSWPGCGKPAVATLTYAYAESTAVVGPLAKDPSDPHSWDLCAHHAERMTVPVGWELVRVDDISLDDDELTALAEAVSERVRGGGVTSGLITAPNPRAGSSRAGGPRTTQTTGDEEAAFDPARSVHPVYRTKRVNASRQARRAHLRVVRDPETD